METVRLAAEAMGTRFEVLLVGEDVGFLRAAGEEALDLIVEEHGRLSRFERDSVVSHVNRNASGGWVGVDGEFAQLLALCDEVVRASRGAFDPTATAEERGTAASGGVGCGWDAVELDGRRVRFAGEGVALDFGAVAKGWALDLAGCSLREAGVERALIHGGTSSVLAIGAPPGETGWRIALGSAGGARCVLCDEALGVSAPDGEAGGVGHVLVPLSGEAAGGVSIAAVVGENAAWADAWATALVVAGEGLPGREGLETAFVMEGEALDCAGAWRGDHAGCFAFPETADSKPI
jgi:thiamine biosynthesis lipoprotein